MMFIGWHDFDQRKSLGTAGSESGAITRDEEHCDGARITLEKGGVTAPFSITCGIYGWMVHTRFFGEESVAQDEFNSMKAGLEHILSLILSTAGRDEMKDDMGKVEDAMSAFLEQFP